MDEHTSEACSQSSNCIVAEQAPSVAAEAAPIRDEVELTCSTVEPHAAPVADELAHAQVAVADLSQQQQQPAGPHVGGGARSSINDVVRARYGMAAWHARARGRARCLRYGMSANSWDGWSQMHVNPFIGMGYFYVFEFANVAMCIYLVTGLPINHSVHCYVVTVPLMVYIAYSVALDFVLWRHGPDIVLHKLYPALRLLAAACTFPFAAVGFLGPESAVPWSNRLHFVCVDATITFFITQADVACKAGEHPLEPRTSVMKPFLRSAMNAVLLVDAKTDLSVIRSLFEQKAHDCWWFGQPGRCGAWNGLIATFSIFAATDVIVCLSIILLGGEAASPSKRMRRLHFSLEVLCLLCELGVVGCTLLHLFNLNDPGNAARTDGHELNRKQMALAFVSLASTLVALIVTMFGTSNALRAARNAWQTIRTSVLGRLPFDNRQSPGTVVVPLHGHGKEELGPAPFRIGFFDVLATGSINLLFRSYI